MNQKFIAIAIASIIVCSAGSAMAQTTASQKFRVVVPTNISIVSPPLASITHNETDANQVFPPQEWVVRGNSSAGLAVSFETQSAFTHTVDPNFKRNAIITLAVGSSTGPASWTVTKSTDQTDYAASDEVASVQASSNGVGRATLNVGLSFITDSFGTFASGDYETTVVGTVSAN
jgi:hypothetical protein